MVGEFGVVVGRSGRAGARVCEAGFLMVSGIEGGCEVVEKVRARRVTLY